MEVGIEGIGFSDPMVLLHIHARCFSDRVSRSGYGAGQYGPVGGCTFYDPQGVGVGFGAAGDPGDGAFDAGRTGRERLCIQQRSVGGVEDSENMITCVRVNAYDKWVKMRDDSQDGHRTSSCDGHGWWPSPAGTSPGKGHNGTAL